GSVVDRDPEGVGPYRWMGGKLDSDWALVAAAHLRGVAGGAVDHVHAVTEVRRGLVGPGVEDICRVDRVSCRVDGELEKRVVGRVPRTANGDGRGRLVTTAPVGGVTGCAVEHRDEVGA